VLVITFSTVVSVEGFCLLSLIALGRAWQPMALAANIVSLNLRPSSVRRHDLMALYEFYYYYYYYYYYYFSDALQLSQVSQA